MADFQITCINGTSGPPWPSGGVSIPPVSFPVSGTWPQDKYAGAFVKCTLTVNGTEGSPTPCQVSSGGTWSGSLNFPGGTPPVNAGLKAYLLSNPGDPLSKALATDGPVSVQFTSAGTMGTCPQGVKTAR
jgi:hypothetical protein